jgi:hypothetical protein
MSGQSSRLLDVLINRLIEPEMLILLKQNFGPWQGRRAALLAFVWRRNGFSWTFYRACSARFTGEDGAARHPYPSTFSLAIALASLS